LSSDDAVAEGLSSEPLRVPPLSSGEALGEAVAASSDPFRSPPLSSGDAVGAAVGEAVAAGTAAPPRSSGCAWLRARATPPYTLDEALTDMRSIAAGLRSPELEGARPEEIVRRAVADHERRSGTGVTVDVEGVPETAPLATKIAMYRILSEALSNAARHGGGADVRVRVSRTDDGFVLVEVADAGPGFDAAASPGSNRLGLAGMRERTELLGGRFELESAPGSGTSVRARLPLTDASAPGR
jgi:signal transduction histidine kinase